MVNLFTAASFDSSAGFMGMGVLALILMFVFAILVVILKGYSLWYAAKRDDKWWFMAILVINTMGILELVYLIFFVQKWPKIYAKKKSDDTSSTPTTPTTSA